MRDPEKQRARDKKWRKLNPERAKEISRESAKRRRRAKGIKERANLTPEKLKALRKEWRKRNLGKMSKYVREWQKRNPEKLKAHHAINHAVEDGKLIKPLMCQRCGAETKLEGHHKDYSKPLDVEWLCEICHTKEHSNGSRSH
jgi:hypothetical protein